MRSKLAAAAVLVTLSGTPAVAQTASPKPDVDALIEQVRKETRADVNTVITDNMRFSADEAAKFWPLYKGYEQKRKALNDEKLALIKDYAASYETMTDAKAKQLLASAVGIEERSLAAKRQFLDELAKSFPAKTVARFWQVHNRLELLVNLQLASAIPLMR
jgi:hypothetical protein